MREIKFRAWHEGNKAFVYATIKDIWINGWHCAEGHYGGLNPSTPKTKEGVYTTEKYLKSHHAFKPNAYWQLFTGLKDKNGIEDYHKNILQDTLTKLVCTVEYGEYKCKNGIGLGWYLQMLNGEPYIPYPYSLEDWEVIGNIYENPELLEAK